MKELKPTDIIREMDNRFTCKTHASKVLKIKVHILRAISSHAKGGSGYPKTATRKNLIAVAKALGFQIIDPEKIYIE